MNKLKRQPAGVEGKRPVMRTNLKMRELSLNMKKILIVDDSAIFRRHIMEKLAEEPDIKIVGEAGDGQEALEKVKTAKPDLILLDIRMPRLNGIEVIPQIKKERPESKVIILTIHDLKEYRKAAKDCGADAFILKLCMDKELIPAIRDAFNPA